MYSTGAGDVYGLTICTVVAIGNSRVDMQYVFNVFCMPVLGLVSLISLYASGR